jgi:hypothetical protein
MGWRLLKREGREEHGDLQAGVSNASRQFQHHCHGARIVVCARRARDGIVMSANNVISRDADGRWIRSKYIRHTLVVIFVVLFLD